MNSKFGKDIDWFVKNIESRKRLLPGFAHASQTMTKEISENLDKFIDEHGLDKVYDESGKLTEFTVPEDYYRRYGILKRSFQHSAIFSDLLPKMTLVSLVSLFDALISRLVKTMFLVKPEILKGSEKLLTYADLSEFDTIEDAKEYLVESEIETLLRKNHVDQFAWLEKKLGIKLTKDLEPWKNFLEITQRRNLLVHADGLVSKNYLKECEKKGVTYGELVSVGDRLGVTQDYYESACDCIAEIGLKLAQVMWRKLVPDDLKMADSSLISVSYDFLTYREYKLALVVTRFNDLPAVKNGCLENTLYLKLNQAVALKSLDRNEECMKLLASEDWSAYSDVFKIAVASLKEQWGEASKLMEDLGPNHRKIGKHEYKTWAIFKWFRKTEEFKEAYKRVFDEEFKIVGGPKSEESESKENT